MQAAEPVSRKQSGNLLPFFLITFVVTWTVYFAVAALPADPDLPKVARELMFLPGTFAPALVAIALTAKAEGRAGVQSLLSRILRWQVAWQWYLFAAGFMIAVKLTAALAHFSLSGEWPAFGEESIFVMFAAILVSAWVQAGEEIGWRGYALPRLTRRMGLASASIVLGVIWASWHLPLFFIPGLEMTNQSFPIYLASVTAISVALAWLFWKSGGSLLLVMLMHAAINNTKDIVPTASVASAHPFTLNTSLMGMLTLGVLWLSAAYFLARMKAIREIPPR